MTQKHAFDVASKRSWQDVVAAKRKEQATLIQQYLDRGFSSSAQLTSIVDIETIPAKILARETTTLDVITAHIDRAIGAHRRTNCLTELLFAEAIETATRLDEHLKSTGSLIGPFHGVPITLKDQFNVKGYDTTLGYVGRAFRPAAEDGHIVEVLRKAGAIVLAKTNLPQSIMWCETDNPLWGLTTNPLNPAFTPGGSTGGEACVLHFGGSLLGWGTDIGGSIRIPSHMNGLFGLKPTSSRLSYVGVPVSTEGQQHVPSAVGPMARSMDSLVFTMKTLLDAKPWNADPAVTPKSWDDIAFSEAQNRPLTIGVMYDDGVVKVHPPIERVLFEMTRALKAAGHEVIMWDPSLHADCIQVMDQYYTSDGGEDIRRDVAAGGEPMIPHVEALVNRAPAISVYDYWQLNKQKIRLQKAYYDKWNACQGPSGRKVDVLLTPTMPHTALPHKGCRWVGYTKIWNFLDYPAVVFPAGRADKQRDGGLDSNHVPRNEADAWNWSRYDCVSMHGHPVGLQIIGPRFSEETVLGAARMCGSLLSHEEPYVNGATDSTSAFDWSALLTT
ncbi:Acetamidase [Cyphellophora attinorum]|uniref:Acetamidase n=1 Tax=Cyphellophora attinorum TaxID=1664694 RepID=A0A0N1NZW4_9EURO|nr:Acetamidase [Phialophora attinorum]KPI38036.1 Acetamidase [Phialophora attinorum]